MSDAVTAAYTALESRMRQLDVLSNNLANVSTPGYKRDFYRILETEAGEDLNTIIDVTPGDMVATKNNLDAAIDGPGFFVLQTPDGIRYTRNGSFSIDADGNLVTKDGYQVLSSTSTAINAGPSEISIGGGGVVTADGGEVATLKIVNFQGVENLEKEGLGLFRWNGAPQDVVDVPTPKVTSGYLEASNVNAVNEISQMVSVYRDFESVQRTLKLQLDMSARLIQELGKLS